MKILLDYSLAFDHKNFTELRRDLDQVLKKLFESEEIIDKITQLFDNENLKHKT